MRSTVAQMARRILKWGPLYDVVRPPLEWLIVRRWKKRGRPIPASHLVKQAIVREYQRAFGLEVLVETGTFLGDMVASTKMDFERIFTVEIDDALHGRAKRKFARFRHISVIHGDSEERLPEILVNVDQPCLFWLDGHYSGGITGRGREDSPVMRELQHIFEHRVKNHVVLIDDARCFTGDGGYPTIERLQSLVRENRPQWSVKVEDDIIRMHPPIDALTRR